MLAQLDFKSFTRLIFFMVNHRTGRIKCFGVINASRIRAIANGQGKFGINISTRQIGGKGVHIATAPGK